MPGTQATGAKLPLLASVEELVIKQRRTLVVLRPKHHPEAKKVPINSPSSCCFLRQLTVLDNGLSESQVSHRELRQITELDVQP